MSKRISRRSFLKKAALASTAAGVPYIIPSSALGSSVMAPPSERLALGFIGVGGMGSAHLNTFLNRSDVEILAVCDVDERRRDAAREKVGEGCAAYNDYRHLLDRPDIDAVIIATPDHWHTLTSIHACQAGKDVYCEKPLTLTVEEALVLKKTVRRYGRVFQTGSQQRSSPEFRRACEIVRSGRIGKISEARVGIGTGPVGDFVADCDPPPGLDWNLWLGPAPRVPFNPARHPYSFRWFFDYSGGKITDWGAHHNDIVQWGFGMDGSGPVKIEGRGTFPMRGVYETAVDFELTYTYEDGRRAICANRGHGVKFIGTRGWVHVDRGFLQTEPAYLADEPLGPGDVHLFRSPGHHQNWLDCIRTREDPICNVDVGAGSVILCHILNIALRTGRPLLWQPHRNRFHDDEEANRFLRKPYRSPWRL